MPDLIRTEEEYRVGVQELGRLIEREDALDDKDLSHLSDLADALIAFERTTGKSGDETFAANVPQVAKFDEAGLEDRSLVHA